MKGFTLIELAIVVVIIGLIIGGVTSGQELIKQANIRNIIRDSVEINRAALTFKTKFDSLPGDFSKAELVWGSYSSCNALNSVDLLTISTTCNGNNNGFIDENLESGSQEYTSFGQQLMLSNLIKNYQSIEIDTSLFKLFYPTSLSINIISIHGDLLGFDASANYLTLGKVVDDSWAAVGINIQPEVAYSLDFKLDDGKPESGRMTVESVYSDDTTCRDSSSPPEYDINTPANLCALLLKADF